MADAMLPTATKHAAILNVELVSTQEFHPSLGNQNLKKIYACKGLYIYMGRYKSILRTLRHW